MFGPGGEGNEMVAVCDEGEPGLQRRWMGSKQAVQFERLSHSVPFVALRKSATASTASGEGQHTVGLDMVREAGRRKDGASLEIEPAAASRPQDPQQGSQPFDVPGSSPKRPGGFVAGCLTFWGAQSKGVQRTGRLHRGWTFLWVDATIFLLRGILGASADAPEPDPEVPLVPASLSGLPTLL
jgi:hypothetical protein